MLETFWTTLQKVCKLANKVTLTRLEIERIITYMALNLNVDSVDIEQSSFGIGLVHVATYYVNRGESVTQDITDVGVW